MLDPGQKKKGGYKTGLSGANLDGYIRGLATAVLSLVKSVVAKQFGDGSASAAS